MKSNIVIPEYDFTKNNSCSRGIISDENMVKHIPQRIPAIDMIIQNMFKLPKGDKNIDAVDCVGYYSYRNNIQEFYNLAESNYYSGDIVYIAEELSEMLREYPDNIKLISLAKNLNYQKFKY